MSRFRPLGEELLSPAAPRGGQAASGCRADGVSQGRAQGARHCAGEAQGLQSRTWVLAGAEGGEGTWEGWGSGRGGGKGSERHKAEGKGRDARVSYPEVSGCDWRLPAARGGGPGGFGTGRAVAADARGKEEEEKEEEEAGGRADQRAGGRVRSASRQHRHCPARQQVSSRPRRPASPRCPLGIPALAPAPRARGEAQALRASQLGPGGLDLLPAGSPRPGAPVPAVVAPAALQLCRDQCPSSAARSAWSCGNGGPFGHLALPPAGSRRLGDASPGGSLHLPNLNFQLSSVPGSPEARPP